MYSALLETIPPTLYLVTDFTVKWEEPEAERRERMCYIKDEAKKGSMARLRKKKISWDRPPNSTGLRYRLYWAIGESVGYGSQFIEFDNVTEVILPDDVTPFPMKGRNVQVGVSSINEAGNESEITKLDVQLDFSVPDAPTNLHALDLDTVPRSKNFQKVVLAPVGIILLIGVGILALIALGDRVLDHFMGPRQNDHAMVTNRRVKMQEEKPSTSEVPISSLSSEGGIQNEQGRSDIDIIASSFKVEAIIWSTDQANSFAVVNGNKVRIGDFIEGAKVTEIERDYVVLEVGESRFRVTIR
jgi:hypothetical protein